MSSVDPTKPPLKGGWNGIALFLRATLGRIVAATMRTRYIGTENIPAEGGAILAGNHVSYMDPVLLWIGPHHGRRVRFMAKSELWDIKLLGWILHRFWAFPVQRASADRKAISTATDSLNVGELVGIFPEGTRNREGTDELGQAQQGVSFIAMRANAPIVPVGLVNTDKIMPKGAKFPRFPKVTILYCTPICPDDVPGEGRKERMENLTQEIMRRIDQARADAREVARSQGRL